MQQRNAHAGIEHRDLCFRLLRALPFGERLIGHSLRKIQSTQKVVRIGVACINVQGLSQHEQVFRAARKNVGRRKLSGRSVIRCRSLADLLATVCPVVRQHWIAVRT